MCSKLILNRLRISKTVFFIIELKLKVMIRSSPLPRLKRTHSCGHVVPSSHRSELSLRKNTESRYSPGCMRLSFLCLPQQDRTTLYYNAANSTCSDVSPYASPPPPTSRIPSPTRHHHLFILFVATPCSTNSLLRDVATYPCQTRDSESKGTRIPGATETGCVPDFLYHGEPLCRVLHWT